MRGLLYIMACLVLVSACQRNSASQTYSWEQDLHQRLLTDFCLTESQVKDYIRKYIPDVTDEQMRAWEHDKVLECMELDGEKRYFRNAGPNLFRLDPTCRDVKVAREGSVASVTEQVDSENIPEIMAAVRQDGTPIVAPRRMRVTYTLTVDTNVVPAGKIVRCWLPYPRTDHPRQRDVKLLVTSEPEYVLASAGYSHSTLYMEKRAVAGCPTVFSETFEYTSYGEWHPIRAEEVKPYHTDSPLYKEFTAERKQHVVFTPQLRSLADSLTADEPNPWLKVCRIFHWIHDHFPWASAREYSTIDNIPEYVLENRHGDSGQLSLLFVALCRVSGIPARFQSGFMMHPGGWKQHGWAEIYLEDIGWIPVDQSLGIFPLARSEEEKYFFCGGVDSWRMLVNQDYGMPLFPAKHYPRSETVDFQYGEVEWEGGNLYFTDWDYDIEIEYLD